MIGFARFLTHQLSAYHRLPFRLPLTTVAQADCCYQENLWPTCGTCSFCEVHNGSPVGVNKRTLADLAPYFYPPGIPVHGANDTVSMSQYLLAAIGTGC